MLHTGPACSLEKLKLSEIISPLQYWGHNLMQMVFLYIFVMVIETVYLLTRPGGGGCRLSQLLLQFYLDVLKTIAPKKYGKACEG